VLASVTASYLMVVLWLHAAHTQSAAAAATTATPATLTASVLMAVLVCLIPPMVGGLLDAADSRSGHGMVQPDVPAPSRPSAQDFSQE
jgi:high-affinity K+ transport system ATPase subunit B